MTFHSDRELLDMLISFADSAVHDSVSDLIFTQNTEDDFVIVR